MAVIGDNLKGSLQFIVRFAIRFERIVFRQLPLRSTAKHSALVVIPRRRFVKLPPKEAWQLAAELREHLDALWDKQFEEDVKAGRLDDLIASAKKEDARGNTRSIDEIVGND
jgi:hypothetical protein